jgi:hypothetical protein
VVSTRRAGVEPVAFGSAGPSQVHPLGRRERPQGATDACAGVPKKGETRSCRPQPKRAGTDGSIGASGRLSRGTERFTCSRQAGCLPRRLPHCVANTGSGAAAHQPRPCGWSVDLRLHGPRQRRLGGDDRTLEGRGRIDRAACAEAINASEGPPSGARAVDENMVPEQNRQWFRHEPGSYEP